MLKFFTQPIIRCVLQKVIGDQNLLLTRKFEAWEIKEVVFSMHPDKSQGPNEMNPGFYQEYWDIIDGQVTYACLKVLNDGILLVA